MPTSKDIFRNGILTYDFQTVAQAIGLAHAIEWGERTQYFADHVNRTTGQKATLTGFIFQETYQEYKKSLETKD